MVEEIIIYGLVTGAVYTLLAIGFSLIWGVARIINLSHTVLFMLAAYIAFSFNRMLGLSLILSVVASIFVVALVGIAVYQVIDRIREHELIVLLVTIALANVFQELIFVKFGGQDYAWSSFISGYVELFGVRVSYQHLLVFGVALIVIVGIVAFLFKSELGIMIRCVAQDREIANLMGINVRRMYLITMAIAAGLAAVAGVMVAPLVAIHPLMWLHPLVVVLAVVILGGLGSIKGTIAGGFILGFVETLVVFLTPAGVFLKGAAALAVMIAVLLIRPEGLFGVVFEEERL